MTEVTVASFVQGLPAGVDAEASTTVTHKDRDQNIGLLEIHSGRFEFAIGKGVLNAEAHLFADGVRGHILFAPITGNSIDAIGLSIAEVGMPWNSSSLHEKHLRGFSRTFLDYA